MSIEQQITRIQNEVSSQSELIDTMNGKFNNQTNYAAVLIEIMQKTIVEYKDNQILEIGASMLSDCNQLISIYTPKLQVLHNYACKGDTALQNIYAPKLVLLGQSSLYNCINVTELLCPLLQEIQSNALYGNSRLQNVDFSSVAFIGSRGLYGCSNLTSLTLPNIQYLDVYALQDTGITELNLTNRNKVCEIADATVFSDTPIASGNGYVYVPSIIYDDYICADVWKSKKTYLKYVGEYPANITKTIYALTNMETEIRVPIYQYTQADITNITFNSASIDTINWSIEGEELIFYVTTTSTVEKTSFSYTIVGQNETFTRTINLSVVDEIPAFSYSVVDLGTTYTFIDQGDDSYINTNSNVNNSFAICRVNFVGTGTATINYTYEGETCCDYGIISNINQELSLSTTTDSTYLKKVTASGSVALTIEEDCFIDIKYRKDGSVHTGSDSLVFQIVLE